MRKVHGRRRVLRWLYGIALGLVGFVGLVLLAAYIVFQTGWGRGVLKEQIQTRMADTFVGGATIGSVEGNPLTELILNDIVINGPDKKPAISVKRLTVKLPLMPLISHQLRVDKVIVDQLDVRLARDEHGELQITKLMKPSESESTWSIFLPNVEVHRGHVAFDTGTEVIDIDNIELAVDAAMPFGGPMKAGVDLHADWRQRKAPIHVGASIYNDDEVFQVRSAVAHVGDVFAFLLDTRVPKSPYMKPFGGLVAVSAPAAGVSHLAPDVKLPGDVIATITARPDGRFTIADIVALVAGADIRAHVRGDVIAKLASGNVSAHQVELARFTQGKLDGGGNADVTFDIAVPEDAELPTANAHAVVSGRFADSPVVDAKIDLATRGEHIDAKVDATSDAVRADIVAAIRKQGDRITLERSHVVASTSSPAAATGGRAPVRGALTANLRASGAIAPNMDLAVAGKVDGKRIRAAGISASTLKLSVDMKHLPGEPVGTGRVEVTNLMRGDMKLGKLTVAAGNRPDGKLQVTVRSRPEPAPWEIDADALVAFGKQKTTIDLQRHFVRAAGGSEWSGRTGQVTITPQAIQIRDLKSTTAGGNISISGTMIRTGRGAGDIAAKLDANLDLQNIKKAYKGHIDARIDVARTRGLFAGTIDAKARGVALTKKALALDAEARIRAASGTVSANVDVATANAGHARVVVDVRAPRDLANTRAWKRLGRGAINTAQLQLDAIDLGQVAKALGTPPMAGKVDGQVQVSATSIGGNVAIRGVQIKQTKDLGNINADIEVAQTGANEVLTTVSARLDPTEQAVTAKDITKNGVARFAAQAKLATPAPDRFFDPAAWQRLGAKAFRGGSVRAERLAFEPGTLERFGIVSALRGEVAASADLDPALKAAHIAVNVYQLRGGLFAKPIDIGLRAIVDDQSSRGVVTVTGANITLASLKGQIPVTLDQLRADASQAKNARLSATLRIPHVPAVTLMNVIGTSQITGGTLDGTVEIGGTVSKPTVDAKLLARDVTVPPEAAKQVQRIEKLSIEANWDGAAGRVAIDADATGGGTLRVRAAGDLDHLDQVTATVDAKQLDIAPLVAFMPGPAGGLGGRLDADFKLRGADPRTADLAGKLHITNGRIPIAPTVGTLFKGDVKIDVANRNVNLNLTGKLGRGDVKLVASAPLEGATPKSGKAQLTINKVQLIGTTQPILTGVVIADVARVGELWRTNVRVDRMTVKVPPGKGQELAPVGAPNDVVFGGEKVHHGENKGLDVPGGIVHDETGPADFKVPSEVEPADGHNPQDAHRKLPDEPVVIAEVGLKNTFVESEEVRGILGGRLRVTVGANSEIGVVGNVSLQRGVLELFGRRYVVDRAALHFDGSTDPVLDIRITHDFPEVTTVTEVRGRMSKPELTMSSDPAQYSQAELLGFLLGGEPGGDPEMAPSATERVAGAGASFVGNKIGGYVKKALPVDVDVLRYEAASASSSAAVTVGTWITDSLFLAYRRHLEARPDENAGEGELEYWIRRRLVLEGVVGDRGVNGLDLLWRRRW
ncbi:MAG: AsmA family protein [Kofleriaceae bacterium]|nr:AsmA family protein [Kofleriaceae bacterium]